VGQVDEIPPGMGKTVLVVGREVTVYNREGRYVATLAATTMTSVAAGAGVVETTCEMPGHKFATDGGPGLTPDRLQRDESTCEVVVEDGGVYVVLSTP
jgi:nitrite reductase/ring-hydroxylating ferredoxin subunit